MEYYPRSSRGGAQFFTQAGNRTNKYIMENITYTLFEGRHDLPENLGAICSGFDFKAKNAVKTHHWVDALNFFCLKTEQISSARQIAAAELRLIVTGLTPALTEFICECAKRKHLHPKLILCHYDKETDSYWDQVILEYKF